VSIRIRDASNCVDAGSNEWAFLADRGWPAPSIPAVGREKPASRNPCQGHFNLRRQTLEMTETGCTDGARSHVVPDVEADAPALDGVAAVRRESATRARSGPATKGAKVSTGSCRATADEGSTWQAPVQLSAADRSASHPLVRWTVGRFVAFWTEKG
jgi:hypothetical protein